MLMSVTVTLFSTDQVFVNQTNGTTNYLADGWSQVGPVGHDGTSFITGVSRVWLKFDLSSIPAGATINSAELATTTFYGSGNAYNGIVIDCARATDISWSESTITWNTADNASVGAVSDSTPILAVDGSPRQAADFGVGAAVAAAFSTGAVSFRLIAEDESNLGGYVAIINENYTEGVEQPQLTITYTPGATSTEGMLLMFN